MTGDFDIPLKKWYGRFYHLVMSVVCKLVLLSTLCLAQDEQFSFPASGGAVANDHYSVLFTLGQAIAGNAATDGGSSVSSGLVATAGRYTLIQLTLPPVQAAVDQPAQISATLSGSDFDAADIYYRMGGMTEFVGPVAMAPETTGGDTWSGTIPAAAVTAAGVQYYIVADDGANLYHLPDSAPEVPAFVSVAISNQLVFDLPVMQYNMLGLPFTPTDGDAPVVFDELGAYNNRIWRFGVWDPQAEQGGAYSEYPDVAEITPGQGFWLISRFGGEITASGWSTSVATDYRLTIYPGWNQIANPYFYAIHFPQTLPPGIDDLLYAYDGSGFVAAPPSVMEVGRGYCVHNSGTDPVELVLPAVRASLDKAGDALGDDRAGANAMNSADKGNPDGSGWQVDLTAQAGRFHDGGNRLGMRADASAERDRCDYLDPPVPPQGHVTLSLLGESDVRFLTDFRSTASGGETWTLQLRSDQSNERFQITIAASGSPPAGWQVLAIDPVSLAEHDLLTDPVLTGTIDDTDYTQRWHVVAGPAAFLNDQRQLVEQQYLSTLTRIALYPARPNPVRVSAGTMVLLAAPRDTHARLRVFDLRGRLVATLHDGELQRGAHRFQWQGLDQQRRPVASGIYFVRLVSPDVSQVQKVTVLR